MPSARTLLLAGAVALAIPATAEAQMTLTITGVSGRPAGTTLDLTTQPINAAECMANVTITVRLAMVPTDKMRLDVWRGTGSTDCSTVEARTPMPTTMCTPLTLMANTLINMRATIDALSFTLSEIVDCAVVDNSYRIYFLASDGVASAEAVTGSAFLPIEIDQTPLPAPTDVMGASGDTQIIVTWTPVDDGGSLQEYRVYGDPNSAVDGTTCDPTMSSFVPGEPVPADAIELGTSTGGSATIDPRELGADLNRSAAIVVVTVDDAGNVSGVSNIACISRVETMGFCDSYGECEDCAVSGPIGAGRGSRAPLGAFSVVLACLALAARRRRRT